MSGVKEDPYYYPLRQELSNRYIREWLRNLSKVRGNKERIKKK